MRCGLSKTPAASATVGSSSSAPMVAPQVGQKALLENDDERQTEGFPAGPTHSTFSAGNSTQVRVREPECLRQLSQEQVCGRPGRPVARNLTAPQRQPPSYCFGFIWCWGATGSGLRRLTFELSGRRRCDGRPARPMINSTASRAWRHAVGAPLERGVRPLSSPSRGRRLGRSASRQRRGRVGYQRNTSSRRATD